ncbi:hypothetical protein LAZ67_2006536 [Cordylochernes scorpioides]|uniref:Reverse transcriptase domain-containing protein n=1 Tax=Cordylochernes scorpioides TaxID=51811 RepID=A0ABY6K683_9ARAC|nr:hypothetical protein LAZ67_2006536 [Cordylochernes scorpioides]
MIGRIVTEDLKLKKNPAKFIPRFLTNEQKLCRLATCEDMLEMTRTDPKCKDKMITGDDTWVYGYNPENKRQSAECRGQAHLVTNIAPNGFFMFPKLKAVLKGRHFDTRDDIIEKSLSDCCLPPTPVYFLEDSRRFYELLFPVLLLLSFTVLQLVMLIVIGGEHKIIHKLKSQRFIVITRSDKGSDTVILNQTAYHAKMIDILNDTTTFIQISAEESKATTKNFRVSLNRMKRSDTITTEDHKNFTSNLGTNAYIYGLPKIHKPSVPLRPVIAYHLSPTYPLAKYLTNLLTPLWNNNRRAFTIPNSTSFIQDITNLLPPPNSSMCSFDVSSLFLSLPHSLMIDNLHQFLSSIHTDATIASNIISLTEICLCMNTFTYSHTHFKQIRGTPMGSPLSSILFEITMSTIDHEDTILSDLHTYNPNITFTLEREREHAIPFLDALVIRTPNTYHTTVYYKKNHPPRYTHYRSHCPTSHKINIVKALTRRLLTHCSLPIFKTIEKNRIISHLTASAFPLSFIEKHTYSPVPLNPPAAYKSTCVIPFSSLSVNLSRFLKSFGIRTFFTNTPNLHSLLRHPITKTDSPTDPLTSTGAVYSVSCQQCPANYVGETGRTIAIRMSEHTHNITNRDPRSLIFQHIASSGHSFDTANPTIHYRNISNLHQRLVLESIVSSKLHSINRKIDIPAIYISN